TQASLTSFAAASVTGGCSVVWCQSQRRTADITTAAMTMARTATRNHPRDFRDGWDVPFGSISPGDRMGPTELKISQSTAARLRSAVREPSWDGPNLQLTVSMAGQIHEHAQRL